GHARNGIRQPPRWRWGSSQPTPSSLSLLAPFLKPSARAPQRWARPPSTVSGVRGVLIPFVAATAASLVFAGTASADAQDDNYLSLIKAAGLGCGQGPFECPTGDSDMISIGRAICRQLTHGNSTLAVSQAIMRQKPDVPPETIARIVAISKAAYCAS